MKDPAKMNENCRALAQTCEARKANCLRNGLQLDFQRTDKLNRWSKSPNKIRPQYLLPAKGSVADPGRLH
jgi:hypothetical protein